MLGPKEQAVEALRGGDPERALELLRDAARATPRDAQIYGFAGVAYGQLQQFEEAVAALEYAVKLEPDSPANQYNLGRALEKVGRAEEAVDAYRQTLALSSRHQAAREALVRLGELPATRATSDPGAFASSPKVTAVSIPPVTDEKTAPAENHTTRRLATSAAPAPPESPASPAPSRHSPWLWAFGIASGILLVLVVLLSVALEHANHPPATVSVPPPAPAPAKVEEPAVVTVHSDTGTPAPSPQDVIARVKGSVVLVLVDGPDGVVSGSGFPVSADHVATCAHVVEHAEKIQILTATGQRINATVDRTDGANDVALLSCGPGLPPALKLGSLSSVREGDEIGVTGYPVVDRFLELGYQPVSSTSRGTISAKRVHSVNGHDVQTLQTDAAINEGNSGGPLISVKTGEVLGLAAAKFTDEAGINFASSADAVKALIPAPGSPAPAGSFALFAVDRKGTLEPVAIVQNGHLSEPPHPSPDGDSQDVLKFADTYFASGRSYHLLFGGADGGTARVVERKDSGTTLSAQAELHATAPIRGRIQALATDADNLARPSRSRRPASKEERDAALKVATDSFRTHGIPQEELGNVAVVNLTATNLDGGPNDELIGTFHVAVGELDHTLFCILEKKGDSYDAPVSEFHAAQDPGGADRQEEVLVDRVDIDGDGTAEVVTVVRGSESSGYRIYSKKNGHWQPIYHTGAVNQ